EDGIRDFHVTGVQTCALPISTVQANEPVSVNDLLNLVQQGQARDDQEFKQRMARFNQSKTEQDRMVADAQAERSRLEQLSAQKEIGRASCREREETRVSGGAW